MKRLKEILSYKRGHESEGERAFLKKFLAWWDFEAVTDEHGFVLAYRAVVGASKTLFTAHVDTVHRDTPPVANGKWAAAKGRSPVAKAGGDRVKNQFVEKGDMLLASGAPLGADDGAGVWLLLEMMEAGVPGTYLFPRGEECGGIGSSAMAKSHAEWLADFDRCISFDRRGTHSVITHQGWGRCASDEFAEALAAALSCDTYFYAPDDTGVFTDSANFVDIIPECTNVSVGYDKEHSENETLDLRYLKALRDKCVVLDWEALPVKRVPGESDDYYGSLGGAFNYGRSGFKRTARPITDDEVVELLSLADPIDIVESMQDLDASDLKKVVQRGKVSDIVFILKSLLEEVSYQTERADALVRRREDRPALHEPW